ncbi:MAG: shikimate dehydrogenase [Dehalococcoidia bacterium]|nr:shikimate dehydrogenase [Dehalococcoidia bacterium]
MTKYIGLIGYPLGHSISPIFQQAALDSLGLDVVYQAWEMEPSRLEEAIKRLRDPAHLGANVTVPHKETVIPMLDQIDDAARRIGAVNTIVSKDGRLEGHNTDHIGFMRALKEASYDPTGKNALILGAGGAARAVVYALMDAGAHSLIIVNRTRERAQALADELAGASPLGAVHVTASPWTPKLIATILEEPHLLVNCTSIGMRHSPTEEQSPLDGMVIPRETVVYDLVYNPLETSLLRQAREAGCVTIGGLPMLIYQGAAAFELWTGHAAPVNVMMAAARDALGG